MGAKAGSALGRALGRLSLLCAARPGATIAGIVVITAVMGLGMTRLSTESNLLDILPEGNPHTEAAQNASAEFRGFYDFATVFYSIDVAKCERASAERLPFRLSNPACGNVTDEAYVRGMEELFHFLRAEAPAAEYAIDLAGIVKTVNYTNSGFFGDDPQAAIAQAILTGHLDRVGAPRSEAWAMPGTDPEGELLYEAAWRGANAADDSVKDVVAPTWRAGRTLLFFNATGHDRVDLGRSVYSAVAAYKQAILDCDDSSEATDCRLEWNVFSADALAVRGVSTLDAHATEVTQRDLARLAPIVGLALVAIMVLSFRDARVIVVSVVNLGVAFVWTAGLMGWMGIPFSALNLTIIPIILGVGIDYGIQMVSEYLDHKAQGLTDEEAFGKAGSLSGMAMFLATVTTIGGLLLMVASPSVLMGQLAIVVSIALTVCFLFAMTMVPALLVLTHRGARRRPEQGSAAILAMCTWLGRHRLVVATAVVVLSGLALSSVGNLEKEAFGNPELNYPKGDRVRDDSESIDDLFFGGSSGTVSNYLIVEGDLTRPEAHRFLDRLTANLESDPELEGFNTASLTRVVRAWLAINQGTPDAVISQIVLGRAPQGPAQQLQYPQTQAEVEATLDDIFASPFANFMTILLNPRHADGTGYDMGMVPFDTRQGLSYEEAVRVWDATERVIAETQAEVPGSGVRVHQFGNNAVSKLFIDEELPWVNKVGIASFLLVTALIAVLTRSWRATLAIATVMAVASLWWLALLPPLGIGLSVGLMLPLVFISAIGSDNALHLIWNLEHLPDARRVYRYVGKAVTIAIVTDAIAFAVFAFQTDLLVRKTMLATVASVTALWLATMLLVPLFYPPTHPVQGAPPRAPKPRRQPSFRPIELPP
jgi:predicted RND superfamily exporter protein